MIYALMRYVYAALFTLLLPFVFLRLWLRGLRLPAYRQRWRERLGIAPVPPLENVIWLHAVSVGEIVSVIPLVRHLQQQTDCPILVTTTTPTGSERFLTAFKDELGKNLYHCYFPFDLPWIWSRFYKRLQVKILILMETEIWPNLLAFCEQKHIPVVIANARMSPKSLSRYITIKKALSHLLKPVRCILTQSERDKQHFAKIGFQSENIHVTGNIKYDLQLPRYLPQEAAALRTHLGDKRYVWIAASTHEGEEAIILKTYRLLKASIPELLCLLVPRHPDRFNQVEALCRQHNLKVAKRSNMQEVDATVDVFLGDSMGEMLLFYAASDIAFVGGSLVPIGGHNLLEPAALHLPVLTGPHLVNFLEISDSLFKANGAVLVNNEQELADKILHSYQDPQQAKIMGENAYQVVQKNKGALGRQLEAIMHYS